MGILPHILHRVTIAEVRSESCNHSSCTTTSISHATLDLFLDCGFAIKPVFLVRNVSFMWLSFVPTTCGETAIEKHLRLQKQAAELPEKIDCNACANSAKATVAIARDNQTLGCESQDVALPGQAILKKSGKRSPRVHLSNSKTRKLQNSSFGTSLGFIQSGAEHHRNPKAHTFADRDPNNTLWEECGARKAAWQWAKKVYRIRGTY